MISIINPPLILKKETWVPYPHLIQSRSLTCRPWKMIAGRLVSFPFGMAVKLPRGWPLAFFWRLTLPQQPLRHKKGRSPMVKRRGFLPPFSLWIRAVVSWCRLLGDPKLEDLQGLTWLCTFAALKGMLGSGIWAGLLSLWCKRYLQRQLENE